ncbi:TetR family transcriptional regulator C-terminal domain-containing protein [Longispora sp. K20-0274]|uniref:TetR/AcrR family transcriptional regulator n=1 Tax=Longispora sp. K20-0274 TaxID=3088255 RepID=UPI00399A8A26
MARPRLSDGTRTRLLEASMSAFLENGYHGTGIKQVLDAVNVPKGSFYNYFASKEELGVAVIRYYAQCSADKLAGALADTPDPLTGVRTFFERQMAEFEEVGFVGGCLLANLAGELDGSEACRRALATAFREWRDGVRDALGAAQAEGTVRTDVDATELADMLIEAWEGAVIRMKIDQTVVPLERCLRRQFDGYLRP